MYEQRSTFLNTTFEEYRTMRVLVEFLYSKLVWIAKLKKGISGVRALVFVKQCEQPL